MVKPKSKRRSSLSTQVKAAVIAAGWRLLASLPLAWIQALAVIVGKLVWRFVRREKHLTRVNLSLCFPHLDAASRDALGQQALIESTRTMLEMGYIWMAPIKRVLNKLVAIEGAEAVFAANQQQPAIILAPHIGQWEIITQWVSTQTKFTYMYSPPRLTELDPVIRQGRCRTGGQLVPADIKGVAGLLKALRRGEMIGILPDQVPDRGQGGVVAPFYGQPALTATLLPKLVQKTQAQVFTALAQRLPKGQGYKLVFIPADARVYSACEATAAAGVNASVEQIIAYAPSQYQWAYKRFKSLPDRNVYRTSTSSTAN